MSSSDQDRIAHLEAKLHQNTEDIRQIQRAIIHMGMGQIRDAIRLRVSPPTITTEPTRTPTLADELARAVKDAVR
jgi:hypothetical protein